MLILLSKNIMALIVTLKNNIQVRYIQICAKSKDFNTLITI